jgi:uncharacterized protein (TIGR02147 family)
VEYLYAIIIRIILSEGRMLSIYNFDDPIKFISTYISEREKIDSNYSLKKFSNSLGMNTAAPVVDMLKRKKRIKSKHIALIAKETGIDQSERMYLEAIIAKSQTDNTERERMYDLIIQELIPNKSKNYSSLKTSNLDIFSHWIYTAILSLAQLPCFEMSVKNIKIKLIESVDEEKIEKALFELFSHGLLIANSDGLIRTQYVRTTTKSDIKHVNVKEYYSMVCDLAKKSIDIPLEQRELNSFSFTIATEDIPLAKEIVRKCRNNLGKLSDKKNTNQVYQANLMLFPISKP